jgi:hypothetical protein
MTRRSAGRRPIPQLLEEYLARGPESNPARLATPAIFVLVRAGILLHGLFARDWPVGGLALFLFAELHFVLRLMTLGNRLTGLGPRYGEVRPADRAKAWVWAAIAFAAVLGAGVLLVRSGAGETFGVSEGTPAVSDGTPAASEGTPAASPILALGAYLAFEIYEFFGALLAARHGGRRFVSAATMSAAFFVIALALAPISYYFLQWILLILGRERAVAEAVGTALVLAKSGAELAVLFYPVAARRMGLRPRSGDPWTPGVTDREL